MICTPKTASPAEPSDLPGLSDDLRGLRVEIEVFAAGPWFELSLHGLLLSFLKIKKPAELLIQSAEKMMCVQLSVLGFSG